MIKGLNHITVAVTDINHSFDFYVNLLGFIPHARWDAGAYLSIGGVWICLSLDCVSPRTDYSHIAFSIDETDFELFHELINNHRIKLWKKNNSEGQSIYFLDPDGHKLEVHCGDLTSRLKSCIKQPYQNMMFFND